MIRQSLHIDGFDFEAGGHLDGIDVAFHTSKPSYNGTDRVVWLCHALTANSDVEDWWPTLVGEGKYFDTTKDFVVCVNTLCSPYGSSGPKSPREGNACLSYSPDGVEGAVAGAARPSGEPVPERFGFDFPLTTVRDFISATIAVRKHLGIEKVDVLIGSSLGGFQAIEWAVTEPSIFAHVFFMATAPRISPWLLAMVETQKMALEADGTFRDPAHLQDLSGGLKGLECARAQAMISYRCFEGYCLTQADEDPDTLFASRAASYQLYQGAKIIRRGFDAFSYYYICRALESNNVGRGRGGVEAALGRVAAPCTVVAIDTDVIFPPKEAEQWARYIPGSELKVITSSFGHDGFLLETEQIKAVFDAALGK